MIVTKKMNVREIIEKTVDKLKRDRKTVFILSAAAVLAVVAAFGGIGENGIKNISDSKKDCTDTEKTEIESIEDALGQKISTLVSNMEGVGNVSVSVCIQSTGTVHYAQDINEKKENGSIFKDSEYIYTEGNAGQPDGLIVRIDAPVIRGVAVVCDGGESAVIKNEIKSLISSLYDIGSDRIYVGK